MGSGAAEVFDNPDSRASILEYVTTKVDSNSSHEELSATAPEFVFSSPSISRVSVSNPFFSPYSSGSPSTPTRSPGRCCKDGWRYIL